MKIWKMNDCDWIAAETLEEAKSCMAEHMSCTVAELEEDYLEEPYALEDAELDVLTIRDADDMAAPPKTFREELATITKFPAFFASTEY